MKIKHTARGFERIEFKDSSGARCSLQQSSAGWAVWLGPDEASPMMLTLGKSWQPVPLPEGTLCTTRALLDRRQVKWIIARLKNWLDDGSFKKKRSIK